MVFKEFPDSKVYDNNLKLPPDCIGSIKNSKIFYAHPRFNGRYIAHRELAKSNERQKPKIEDLLRQLRKISTRNQLTHTILSVVIEYQAEYLAGQNLLGLRPLTGQAIKVMAEKKCDLINNCVISRLIKNKTIMLPWGEIIYLKDLIPGKKKMYKKYIKDVVQKEYSLDKFRQPLNDSKIKKVLKKRYGISVNRRSVCQARKELGISSWRKRRKKLYCQLALRIFSTFYPLGGKAINRYAPESPGVYELCINRNELAYPKRKSGKFYIGSAQNIKKRLMSHLNPNHKNANIAGYIKKDSCFFRFAGRAKTWRKLEKQLYDLFRETYGASPIGNKLSP